MIRTKNKEDNASNNTIYIAWCEEHERNKYQLQHPSPRILKHCILFAYEVFEACPIDSFTY